jgi:hypothetical protein
LGWTIGANGVKNVYRIKKTGEEFKVPSRKAHEFLLTGFLPEKNRWPRIFDKCKCDQQDKQMYEIRHYIQNEPQKRPARRRS